jgi:hypothetical protein
MCVAFGDLFRYNVTVIKELGYQKTPLGDLTLRRRLEPRLQNQEVYEVKLGEEYLMSSLFTESERQLATPWTGKTRR